MQQAKSAELVRDEGIKNQISYGNRGTRKVGDKGERDNFERFGGISTQPTSKDIS